MSRDGSGNYSLPAGNPVGTGTTISSTVHNATMIDVAAAITASIAKDGQTTPSANLPMGGFKHTAVASGTARDQYASVAQVQDGGVQYVGSVSGVDTITGTLTPAITAYAPGMMVILPPAGTNTGAVTLNLNALGAKAVINTLGTALTAGNLRANNPAMLVYNGTSFVLVSPDTATGAFTGTLTGCTTSPTGTITWTRTGNVVTLYFNATISGTSNSTEMTVTGIPVGLRPIASNIVKWFDGEIRDNGNGSQYGLVIVSTGGALLFTPILNFAGAGAFGTGIFTTSGSKGIIGGATITYGII